MTDILEKLDERINRADHGVDRQMAREAKAEIERLRAECTALSVWACVHPDGKTGVVYDEHANSVCAKDAVIAGLRAEIAELRDDLDTWKLLFPDLASESVLPDRLKVGSENNRLRAENERLRAALEPFAKAANDFDGEPDKAVDRNFIYCGWRQLNFDVGAITVGDLRRARAALEGK